MATLSPRSARILATLVTEHIQTAEPVGSARLADRAGLGLSSATVRSTLASLEDLGFVRQPHTSAGRVPTDRGYRFYVDRLLETFRPVHAGWAVEARLRRDAGTPALAEDVLAAVSQVLSRSSRLIGFALPPADHDAVFQEIEFLPVTGSKVLVVMVAEGAQVSRKAIDVGEVLTPQDLRQAANYLTTEFAGLPLERVRAAVIDRLRQERTLRDALMLRAFRLARSSFEEVPRRTPLFVDGASSLLSDQPDDTAGISFATLRALMRMVEEKERLVRILSEYIDGPGLTVVIGHEHTTPDLRPFSLVASTYVDGPRRGTVGVIGPMRMPYSRTIAVVDGMAHAVSRVLRDSI
jgi:heat-inducible transcriptional repressor